MRSYDLSAELLERAKRSLAGGVSSEFRKFQYPHGLFFESAEGAVITDVDGNRYLDFSLSQGPMLLGHSHPHVIRRVSEYSSHGQLFAGQHRLEVELAEKLQRHIPSAELMRFCLDGSEAVQTALRVARAKTGRPLFIRFEGHYHGWLDNVAWIPTRSSEPATDAVPNTAAPWGRGIPDRCADEFILLPWNDRRAIEHAFAEHGARIAAVITEPVMCNNGCIAPLPGYLEYLRAITIQYGAVLIFDEVITGFRTSLGGAQTLFGITPDISIFAKAMASGYPISAVVGKGEWMESLANGSVIQAGTMNASNATVAAALATIEVLENENPYERLFHLGRELMAGISESAQRHGHPLLVQGPGPMFHTGFTHLRQVVDFTGTLSFDPGKLGKFVAGLQERGIRVLSRGLWYMSTSHTREHVQTAIAAADAVLQSIE